MTKSVTWGEQELGDDNNSMKVRARWIKEQHVIGGCSGWCIVGGLGVHVVLSPAPVSNYNRVYSKSAPDASWALEPWVMLISFLSLPPPPPSPQCHCIGAGITVKVWVSASIIAVHVRAVDMALFCDTAAVMSVKDQKPPHLAFASERGGAS